MRAQICDDCKSIMEEDSNDKIFSISWYGENESLEADLCDDCLPDSVREVLRHEEWDDDDLFDA